MTDSKATERICELLAERGIDYKLRRASATSARETVFWEYEKDGDWATAEYAVTVPLDGYGTLEASNLTPEQAIAATLGVERDEIYNAGFDNGVKACLQILDGYLEYPHSAAENIQKWVDEQWEEYGA